MASIITTTGYSTADFNQWPEFSKFVLVLLAKYFGSTWQEILQSELGYALLELAAFATIGDVMELKDENRIIVRCGLELMKNTRNIGLRALMDVTEIQAEHIKPYTIGFVLGPCLNATGRLDTAANALELFCAQDTQTAVQIAGDLKAMNDSRKELTNKGVEGAVNLIEHSGIINDKVLVAYLPDVHESLAGIIAGRIREKYGKPTFVLTDAEDGVKGSGRSIEAFHMYDEMTKCKELFTKYGGHKLAAGLSLPKENVEPFRKALNNNCALTDEDFEEKVLIDVPMPMDYASIQLVEELALLEPFGNGNPKPQFAHKDVRLLSGRILGVNKNVGKYVVESESGKRFDMIYFGDLEAFNTFLCNKFGAEQAERLYEGGVDGMTVSVVYYPDMNEFRGRKSLQMVMKYYQ